MKVNIVIGFGIMSILTATLIYNPYSRSGAFAMEIGPIECVNNFAVICCQSETDDEGIEIRWCTQCNGNANYPEFIHNCNNRYIGSETSPTSPTTPPSKNPKESLGSIFR